MAPTTLACTVCAHRNLLLLLFLSLSIYIYNISSEALANLVVVVEKIFNGVKLLKACIFEIYLWGETRRSILFFFFFRLIFTKTNVNIYSIFRKYIKPIEFF